MLDENVQDKGYALLCVAQPQSDCEVQTIEEVYSSHSNVVYHHVTIGSRWEVSSADNTCCGSAFMCCTAEACAMQYMTCT